ncbi:hypothetical protein B0J14DRAFT_475059 [Halenospora varia]|nr:hypothetical protein B0J14DRAFT_475059 [Halenospora varia]
MHSHEDHIEPSAGHSVSLPRIPSFSDFSKLFRRRRRGLRNSGSRRSGGRSSTQMSDNISENSQALYMVDPKTRRGSRRSLSVISNAVDRELDGSSEPEVSLVKETAAEEISWHIIDQEIAEWQYMCETGRPYWWSPESKQQRLKRLKARVQNTPPSRPWVKELDRNPLPTYGDRCRAVSEGYLTDPDNENAIAHMVAVQLLGSCFTLPPDCIIDTPPPNHTTLEKHGLSSLPDTRMISSLRLHTQFRYSPCFGHEARNPSPIHSWPGVHSSVSQSATDTGFEIPHICTLNDRQKRRRGRRTRNVTEGSVSECSMQGADGYISRRNTGDLDPAAATAAWYNHARNIREQISRALILPHLPSDARKIGSKNGSGQGERLIPPRTTPNEEDIEFDEYEPPEDARSSSRNYRLQPIIRSEPHHVFVQPVRELVVKRWRSIRRRFGGSLHAALPTNDLDDRNSINSESGTSATSSPAVSPDGRARRIRAQERGEIHSADSTPHNPTPNSGIFSEDDAISEPPKSPARDMPKRPKLPSDLRSSTENPLAAAALLAASDSGHRKEDKTIAQILNPTTPTQSPSPISPDSGMSTLQSQPSSPGATSGNVPNNTPSDGPLPSRDQVKPMPASPPLSFSSMRIPKRQRRKSLLSEVYVAEDLEPEPRAPANEEIDNESEERPSLWRMSTSGTQVFKPDKNGVEVDGLPVGPSKDIWAGKGGRKEHTYL